MSRYLPLVDRYAAQYGVPLVLARKLFEFESNWDPQAVSEAGAIGLGQLMPSTAKQLGVDPTNPEQNIEGSLRYLRQQFDAFGDWGRALGAYHSGPGNMRTAGDPSGLGPRGRRYVARLGGYATDVPATPITAMPQPPQPAPVVPLESNMYEQPQGPWDRLMADPIFALGASLLAQAGGQTGSLGQGLMLGIGANRQSRRDQEAAHYRALALAEKQREQQQRAMQEAQLEEFIRSLPPQYQSAARINPDFFIQQMFGAPDGPKPTDDMREYEMALSQGFDGSFLDYVQTVKRAGAAQVNVGMGSVPSGYERFEGPTGATLRPTPGHPDAIAAELKLDAAAQAVRDFDNMISLIENYGSELMGEKSGEMSALYGQLTSHIARMRDMGVLQEGERAAIEAKMPDPTSIKSVASFKSTALGNYKMSRRLLEAKLKFMQRTYAPWGIGPQPQPQAPDYLEPVR